MDEVSAWRGGTLRVRGRAIEQNDVITDYILVRQELDVWIETSTQGDGRYLAAWGGVSLSQALAMVTSFPSPAPQSPPGFAQRS